MAIQIANPAVVAKIETLARKTGLTKTAAVEQAVDAMLKENNTGSKADTWKRFDAILAQLDQLPQNKDAPTELEWDENGLPI